MKGHPGESVDVHSPFDFLKTELVPAVTDIRAGYRAWVRAYWNGGSCHYVAAIELPVGAGSTDRTALIRYSYHTEPEGFGTSRQARDAAWAFIDDHWVGRTAEEVKRERNVAQEMVRGLLHGLGYVGDRFESPVAWHCRGWEAGVTPEGKVAHSCCCVVGQAERILRDDPHYQPPAGDPGLEAFFAG